MFDDIGKKIKNIAVLFTTFCIIGGLIGGILLLARGTLVLGLVLLIAVPVASWVSSFALYGFGQLIENTDLIVKNIEEIKLSIETPGSQPEPVTPPSDSDSNGTSPTDPAPSEE